MFILSGKGQSQRRGLPVVVVPVYNAPDETIRCFESLIAHTPAGVDVLVIDDCGDDRLAFELLDSVASQSGLNFTVHRMPINSGFVVACNTAFELTRERDVVLVNSDVVVGPDWYTRLYEAAHSSTDIGTVTALTNYGTIVSVPHRNTPTRRLPHGMSVDEAATRIANRAQRLYPVLPTAIGHCMYITRSALNLAGHFDTTFAKGYGEEVDFSQRLIRLGLKNILADDVFVFHKGEASFGESTTEIKERHQKIIDNRYHWYVDSVRRASTESYSNLPLALDIARHALIGYSVGIDAMCLGKYWSGTQQLTAQMILALADNDLQQEFTIVVSEALTRELREIFETRKNIQVQTVGDIYRDYHHRFDIVYRPHQINSTEELRWLKRISDRVIVGQLDLISYHNPSYFKNDHEWLTCRQLTSFVLRGVDGVAFNSEFVQRDAQREGLLQGAIASAVTYNGLDHQQIGTPPVARQPKQLAQVEDPFILVFGVAYFHKARHFAVQVLAALRDQGWNGKLVLVGAMPENGSSYSEEARVLLANKDLRHSLVSIGEVTEDEKEWLLANAALVLNPSVAEGFGLMPFEAALHGTPVVSSRSASLHEVLPSEISSIESFSPVDVARQCLDVMNDPDLAESNCASLVKQASTFTWEASAIVILQLMETVLTRPKNPIEAIWSAGPDPQQLRSPQTTLVQRVTRRFTPRIRRGPRSSH
jgi:GT2 family glycosyltransferase